MEGGHQYVDLGLSVKWAKLNIGASNIDDYGYYFAWGETEPKTEYSWDSYKYANNSYTMLKKYNVNSEYGKVDNKRVLDPEDDAARVMWGEGWRIPTQAEIDELNDPENCDWMPAVSVNGVIGFGVISKKPGFENAAIFIPAAGYIYDSTYYYVGEQGYYWSSSLNVDRPCAGYEFDYATDYHSKFFMDRNAGLPIRPVCP